MIDSMKSVYQAVQVVDMSKDMQEEERLLRETRISGDKESYLKSTIAHESRRMESSAKFMNVCSMNMATQVRTK